MQTEQSMRAAWFVGLAASMALALVSLAPAQAQSNSNPPAQTEAQRRAVFFCNADQRDDQLRNGYPTYTCDPVTGEKKPVPQTVIIDRDGNRKMVYPGQPQN